MIIPSKENLKIRNIFHKCFYLEKIKLLKLLKKRLVIMKTLLKAWKFQRWFKIKNNRKSIWMHFSILSGQMIVTSGIRRRVIMMELTMKV